MGSWPETLTLHIHHNTVTALEQLPLALTKPTERGTCSAKINTVKRRVCACGRGAEEYEQSQLCDKTLEETGVVFFLLQGLRVHSRKILPVLQRSASINHWQG